MVYNTGVQNAIPNLVRGILITYWYLPTVQAGSSKTPHIVSATNAACSSYSTATFLVSYWSPWTVEEGDMAAFFFFVQDLGLTLQWRKRVPTDRRPSKRSRMVRRFRRKKPLFFFRFFSFWTIRFQVPQGMRTFFRANIRRIDCVRSYIQVKYLRPKSILDWNEVNYKATRQVVVSAKKSRMLTPFF